MRIIQIFPEAPFPTGSGGQVRAYHFARVAAALGELSACVLVEPGQVTVASDLAAAAATVLQPPAGSSQRQPPRESRSRWLGPLRALGVLAAPWRSGGKPLLTAGAVNCVGRAEAAREAPLSLPHQLYAALIYAQARLCARLFNFLPTGALVRSELWQALLPEILRWHENRHIDVIWCEHSYLYPFAEQLHRLFPQARLVCDAHNVEFLLNQRIGQGMKSAIARWWTLLEAAILRRWEERMLRRATLTFACSENDAALLRAISPNAHVEVVPNGVDTDHFKPVSNGLESPSPTLLFTGAGGYPPNDDAVAWLISEILPLIRREIPQTRLFLAGKSAETTWSGLAGGDPLIEFASDVPDMRPYFQKAWIALVPLRSGSGTRLKILEAMAMGRAVVSTTLGAEGIEGIPGTHLACADSASGFSAEVVRLLRQPERRQRIGQAGRQLVCEKYDWALLRSRAIQAFTSALPQRS